MMAAIQIDHHLPFVEVILYANTRTLILPRVLLDTGSAATIFRTDDLLSIGVTPQPEDTIHYMSGIGGVESVIEKEIEAIEIDGIRVSPFQIQLGALDYGISMNGILGFDFLLRAEVLIDFKSLQIGKNT
jgi:hypothetical protein